MILARLRLRKCMEAAKIGAHDLRLGANWNVHRDKDQFFKNWEGHAIQHLQNDHKIDREFLIVASICRKIHKTNTENQRRTWGGGEEGQKKIEKDCIKVNFKGEK